MPRERKLPSTEELVRLRDEGWTLKRIAETYGVSTGAVHLQLKATGRTASRPRYGDLIPWRVRPEHDHQHPITMLRLLARRRAGDLGGVSPARLAMLESWLQELHDKDLVVRYDERIPPNPASPTGGWAYVPRDGVRDDDVIRRPSRSRAEAP